MRNRFAVRAPGAALTTAAIVCALLAATTRPGYTDDRDLLRFAASKPYLFILLDTSASMNLEIGGANRPLIGGGDNPNSRLYAAKQALYNVFANVADVHFGFASFNQDAARVRAKHYLYYDPGTGVHGAAKQAGWPAAVGLPAADPDGLTVFVDELNLTNADANGDGKLDATDGIKDTYKADVDGDVFTFGTFFDLDRDGNRNNDSIAGSCKTSTGNGTGPLPLGALGSVARLKIDTFALLGANGTTETTMWLSAGNPTVTYKLTVTHVAGALGDPQLTVTFTLQSVDSNCDSTATWTYTPVLARDAYLNETVIVDGDQLSLETGGNAPAEVVPGLWPVAAGGATTHWTDAIANAACNSGKPFSGKGWEGNYDSGDAPPAGVTGISLTNDDRFCIGSDCIELKPVTHTTYSTLGVPAQPNLGRPLDSGDMLPYDWDETNKSALLRRLAPNTLGPPDFGIGKLLAAVGTTGHYGPPVGAQAPLIGLGNTPLGKAILDFRCWYMGQEGNNGGKCSAAATSTVGWHKTACTYDPEYGCRKPYLIVISDGEDNCPGENPSADTASLHSHSGIKTWAINLGASANNKPEECSPNSVLHSITQNAGGGGGKKGEIVGECVMVHSPEQLHTTVQRILGIIKEEARSFASAAVPSVQAVADQAIFLTNFTPLNNNSRWPGHVNAFLKPLPLTADGRPDTSCRCGEFCASRNKVVTDGCYAWDAAEVLAGNAFADPPVTAQSTRYVRYSRRSRPGLWPTNWRELEGTDGSQAATAGYEDIRYDLWRAFDIIEETQATDSLTDPEEANHEATANAVIANTLAPRTRTPCDATKELCTYLLGDIFHSDPLVVGQPGNIEWFRRDLGSEFNLPNASCEATGEANSTFDRGYRCYFSRHQFRRQVVMVGSNDGMMHAFNVAQFRPATGRYDNGTGHELFAHMPRAVMPTVKLLAEGPVHHYAVDGAVVAADVFIDPVDDGSDFPTADHRRWRTVAVGGLREGGRGYYALDVTQPDRLDNDFHPNYQGQLGGDHLPSCLNFPTGPATEPGPDPVTECGPVSWGAPLWEFTDTTDNAAFADEADRPGLALTMDEDFNGEPDLGFTWSTPDFARIAVCEGTACSFTADPATSADVTQRFVVVFGGGMDPERKRYDPRAPGATVTDPNIELSGHWLYMVDVETGTTLYKHQLCSPYAENTHNQRNPCIPGGAVPSQVAAVDTDLNGFVDRIYVGSIGGFLYRLDLAPLATQVDGTASIEVPAITDMVVNVIPSGGGSQALTVRRIANDLWIPEVLFDTNWDGTTPTDSPRPIYFRPAVIFNPLQSAGGYALAFGTGDREDLWNAHPQDGRFYLFMDDTDDPTASVPAQACGTPLQAECPRTEQDFQRVDLTSGSVMDNFLLTERGWFMPLDAKERVITDAFSFLGITFFSSFEPETAITDSNGEPLTENCGNKQYESNTSGTCAKIGTSNLFLVNATNGNPLLIDAATGDRTRSRQVSTFVTNPFTEFSGGGKGQTGDDDDDDTTDPTRTADDLTDTDKAVMEMLKELFPDTCRFVNARVDVKTVAADTTLQKLASIPICLTGHSWKEF